MVSQIWNGIIML
ncbi:hypothetical protein F383_18568 [Gossypium arboreum]|uniref:Uncharacterized protein n=1 Tax=Gossypium arboreum TaxID=29729 RepID=A0A0B0MLB1_GOSAR|nr:hypothetical protein F383_18568 [Gossypium arboreum]